MRRKEGQHLEMNFEVFTVVAVQQLSCKMSTWHSEASPRQSTKDSIAMKCQEQDQWGFRLSREPLGAKLYMTASVSVEAEIHQVL